jgi:isopenicillin-N N-acyltransferase like protein
MSVRKHLANLAAVIFISALVVGVPGCGTSPHPAPAQTSAPQQPDKLDPIQSWNKFLGALAEGDKESIRAFIHIHPGDGEQARLDGALTIFHSIAGLRQAFDQAYGTGRLAKLGFLSGIPAQLPKQSTFKIEGDHATVSVPGGGTIPMVRDENIWQEEARTWQEVLRVRSEEKAQTLSLDRLLLNDQAVSQILDRTADEVRTGAYLSAADAFGVLNERLHGQATTLSPEQIAYAIDLISPNPAATNSATSPVPIIELRGDPAALGQAQASQLGDAMRSVMHDYFGRAFNLSDEKGRKNYQRALKVAAGFERYILPEHREEIHALAASAGIDPAEAMLGQCFPDLNPGGACSTISLPAEASLDGIARFARNLDYITLGILNQHTVLLVFHPKDRYAFVSVAPAPGMIGVLSGMNEHGLSLAVMEVPRSFRLPQAMPYMLLYRTVLENCKTVDEAIALLQKTPRQSANNLMLMDASGERVVAELTPSKVTVRRAPRTAALISTNHQRGSDLDSSGHCTRYDSLHDAARRQFGQLSESTVEAMLAGAAQGDMTFQSMVFEPANRILYLATGAYAPGHGFTRIDLKPYF